MAYHRLDTVNQLTRWQHDLAVECPCGHKAILNSTALAVHHMKGGRRELSAIQRRLRCSMCGGRRAHCFAVSRD